MHRRGCFDRWRVQIDAGFDRVALQARADFNEGVELREGRKQGALVSGNVLGERRSHAVSVGGLGLRQVDATNCNSYRSVSASLRAV